MALLSTTYDDLLTVAARALGWDRATLSDADAAHIAEMPNLAVTELLSMRDWPHLKKQTALTYTIGQPYLLLPADFAQFWPDTALNYGPDAAYNSLQWTTPATIERFRAQTDSQDIPRYAAVGDTIDQVTAATATPGGSGSFSGSFKYRWRHVSADSGIVTLSDVIAAVPSSNAYVTVSGWPTDQGTVTIYRTKTTGNTLYAITASIDLDATAHASYNDATADGSLSTTLFPDTADATDTLIGRRKLLLYRKPSAVFTVYGYYRRAPRVMSAGTDKPDVPQGLITALRAYTMIVAQRERQREIPVATQNEFARLEMAAWNQCGTENRADISSLRRRRRGGTSVPDGRRMRFAADLWED